MLVYTTCHEKELLTQLAAGDDKAFAELYQRYKRFLTEWVLKFVKLPELAEDISQEIFLRIWENRTNISEVQSFRAYLIVVSRNHALNILKRVALDEAARNQSIRNYQLLRNQVEEDILSKEYRKHLQIALESLPSQTQKVFHLCREQQKTYEEVALILGISRNAVKKHIIRSTKSLKDFLRADLDISLPLLVLLSFLS